MIPLAIFTALYFACGWWLSITPSKLLDRVGKVLTPIFVIMIILIIIVGMIAYTTPSEAVPMGNTLPRPLAPALLKATTPSIPWPPLLSASSPLGP